MLLTAIKHEPVLNNALKHRHLQIRRWQQSLLNVLKITEARKIIWTAGAVLAIATLSAGLCGFWVLQQRTETLVASNLAQRLNDHLSYFENVVSQRLLRAEVIATIPMVAEVLAASAGSKRAGLPAHTTALLTQLAQGYLAYGIQAIAYENDNRQLLAQAGTFKSLPEVVFAMRLQHQPLLFWDKGFYLRVRLPILQGDRTVGVLWVEQKLSLLTQMAANPGGWGQTGELVICAAVPESGLERMQCFPQRFRPHSSINPRLSEGEPFAMSQALAGLRGTLKTQDYRGKKVVAAYQPSLKLGIGMVMKMDVAELYAPIRNRFKWVMPLLIGLVLLGMWAMRWRIRPLVHEIMRTRNIALENETRFRAATESSLDAFWLLASEREAASGTVIDFRMTYLNTRAEKLLGVSRHEVVGKCLSEISPSFHQTDLFEKYRSVLFNLEVLEEEFPVTHGRFNAQWLHHQIVPLANGIAVTSSDISARKAAESNLLSLAHTDSLTGLPNRALFIDRLEQAIQRARRFKQLISLFYLDVDQFKLINDTLGHAAGDEVLCILAERLRHQVRAVDTVARLGGDEFVIILELLQTPADADRIARLLLESIRTPFVLHAGPQNISLSIGVAFYEHNTDTIDTLIQRADQGLYAAKRNGRNCHVLHHSTSKQPA